MTWLRSPSTPPRLTLANLAGKRIVQAPDRQIVINNAALIRTMLIEDGGFALLPEFTVREALAVGTLSRGCPEWSVPDVDVHALYTERRTALTNARAFVDHIQTALSIA